MVSNIIFPSLYQCSKEKSEIKKKRCHCLFSLCRNMKIHRTPFSLCGKGHKHVYMPYACQVPFKIWWIAVTLEIMQHLLIFIQIICQRLIYDDGYCLNDIIVLPLAWKSVSSLQTGLGNTVSFKKVVSNSHELFDSMQKLNVKCRTITSRWGRSSMVYL